VLFDQVLILHISARYSKGVSQASTTSGLIGSSLGNLGSFLKALTIGTLIIELKLATTISGL
jgi:hypothetical protein